MKRLKRALINHFNFSPVEVRGFFVLIILLITFIFLPTVWKKLSPVNKYDKTVDQALLDSLLLSMQEFNESELPKKFVSNEEIEQRSLFKFDPNTATEKNFIDLGVKEYIAARIIKYRSKGGKFYQKKDLLKIYGFSEELYETLAPYIVIPAIKNTKSIETSSVDKDGNEKYIDTLSTDNYAASKPQKFNLNKADTSQLKQVYGIGTTLANRIVNFRDKLGGFHSTDQLQEVYGLKPEVAKALLEIAELPTNTNIEKIEINKLDAKALQKHPYISWKAANFIIKYRKQHGPYKSIHGLKDIKVFDDDFIKKITPYISFIE